MSKHAICYTCDENIPEESIIDSTLCPECGGKVADRWGKVMIVEGRQTDEGNAARRVVQEGNTE